METSVFGLTANDLQQKMQPKQQHNGFSIGPAESDDISEAAILNILAVNEDRVLSHLPERYRDLMTFVDGERIVRSAKEGQVTAKVGLLPVIAGSVRIYVNFPATAAWSEREPDPSPELGEPRGSMFPLRDEDFSINLVTGEIVFNTPLRLADEVRGTYKHGAAKGFLWLKECALTYAAIELSRRFTHFSSAEGVDRFRDWNIDADMYFKALSRGGAPGAAPLEGLDLVRETRRAGQGLKKIMGRF